MLFAIIDYIRYRYKPGRFGNLGEKSWMNRAFRGHVPKEVIEDLKPGDLFFVQTLGSWLSWLIMYLTKSEISHIATYAGNSEIMHATLSGIHLHPLNSIISNDTIVLPCNIRLDKQKQSQIRKIYSQHLNKPYNKKVAILKGLRILFGRDPLYFRFTFLIDIAFFLLTIDFINWIIFDKYIFIWLLPTYLLFVIINYLHSLLRPLKIDHTTAKPVEVFMIAHNLEADFYLDPKKINV